MSGNHSIRARIENQKQKIVDEMNKSLHIQARARDASQKKMLDDIKERKEIFLKAGFLDYISKFIIESIANIETHDYETRIFDQTVSILKNSEECNHWRHHDDNVIFQDIPAYRHIYICKKSLDKFHRIYSIDDIGVVAINELIKENIEDTGYIIEYTEYMMNKNCYVGMCFTFVKKEKEKENSGKCVIC